MLEGTLHITSMQASSCLMLYGDALDTSFAPALADAEQEPTGAARTAGSLPTYNGIVNSMLSNTVSEDVMAKGSCLATPCDPPEDAGVRPAPRQLLQESQLRQRPMSGDRPLARQTLSDRYGGACMGGVHLQRMNCSCSGSCVC